MSLDQNLELFFGASSDAATHVYARAPRPEISGAVLEGRITGPYCQGIRTLPMTVSFQDLGSGPTLLGRAVVPDLAPWSPDQPHLYKVQVKVRTAQTTIDVAEREWSVHRFGTKDTRFVWNAKRFVIRGIRHQHAQGPLEAWQENEAIAIVDEPDEPLCKIASQSGVPIIAVIRGPSTDLPQKLKWLARWPAVLVAWVEGDLPSDFAPRLDVPNLVIAATMDEQGEAAPWAQVYFASELVLRARGAAGALPQHVPLVATRSIEPHWTIEAARAQCDRLQADLARFGQFAGYVVW